MKTKTINYLKENKMEFYLCHICSEIVSKSHFDSEEHIKKFNSVCDIEMKKSFQKAFISTKIQFIDTRYNYIYTDLNFQKTHKRYNIKKYYKSYIIKKIC